MARKLTEAQIERQCSDYLALDGWRALKTDPCSDKSRAKGFGEKGMADHLYLRYAILAAAEVLWVEYKGPRGVVSDHQVEWHTAERARGAATVIAKIDFAPTFEGFVEWYRKSGLLRRAGL